MGCNLQDYASHSQFEILSRASRCSGERSEGQDKTLEDRPSSLRRRGFYARGHGAMQRAAFPRTPAGVWGSETPKAENGDHPSAAMESPQPKNRPISVLFVDEESGHPPNMVPLQLRLSRPQLRSGRATRLHLHGWLQPPRPGRRRCPSSMRLARVKPPRSGANSVPTEDRGNQGNAAGGSNGRC